MSTMLLTAYARSMGSQYLKDTLTLPLRDVYGYCAMELQAKSMDSGSNVSAPSEQVLETDRRLVKAADTLLKAIVDSQKHMPPEVRRICCYIEEQVQQVISNPESFQPAPRPMSVSAPPAAVSTVGLVQLRPPKKSMSSSAYKRFSWSFSNSHSGVKEGPENAMKIRSTPGSNTSFVGSKSESIGNLKGSSSTATSNHSYVENVAEDRVDATRAQVTPKRSSLSAADNNVNAASLRSPLAKVTASNATQSNDSMIAETAAKQTEQIPEPSKDNVSPADPTDRAVISPPPLDIISPSSVDETIAVLTRAIPFDRPSSDSLAPPEVHLPSSKSQEIINESAKIGTAVETKNNDILVFNSLSTRRPLKQNSAPDNLSYKDLLDGSDTDSVKKDTPSSSTPIQAKKFAEDHTFLSLPQRIVGTLVFLRFIVPAITAPDHSPLASNKVDNNVRRGLIQCGKILNGFCSEADFRVKESSQLINEFIDSHKTIVRDFITCLTSTVVSADKKTAPIDKTTAKPVIADKQLCLFLSRSVPRIERDLKDILDSLLPSEAIGVAEGFTELKQCLIAMNLEAPETPSETLSNPRGGSIMSTIGRKFGELRKGVSGSNFFLNSFMGRERSMDNLSTVATSKFKIMIVQ